MDDIVKRLRSGGTPQVGGKLMTWEKQCAEAADEIDRLRAGLKCIARNTCCDGCQEAAKVAARTLKEGE